MNCRKCNKELTEKHRKQWKADMVYTDPPYGMNLDTDYTKRNKSGLGKKYRPVIGDDKPFDPAHIFEMFGYCNEIFLWGGDYYAQRLPEMGSWIVWDKTEKINSDHYDHNTLQNAGFASAFELCWSKSPHKRYLEKLLWRGIYGEGKDEERTFAGGHIDRKHPTQKPILLIERQLNRFGKDKTNVVDLYLGSGSTLIACEKTNHKCFGMEIDPHYCSVIIERWQKFSGKKALLESKPIVRKKGSKVKKK